ncbi:AI-2E family transporter [Rothia halotolerans]|uniref:AI-2E family transporter n=1 Tax=Rothia halotolerans TaxID=405770 RepID=UPI00101DFA19|nr:AI-2E family transporter [Rothia halotolerans]
MSQNVPEEGIRSRAPLGVVALVVLGSMVVLMAGLQSIAGIFGPAFLAFSLVIALRPLRLWLMDRGLPGWVSGVFVALLLYAILLAIIGSMGVSVVALVESLPGYSAQFQELYRQLQDWMAQLGLTETDLGSTALNYLQPERVISAATTVLSGLSEAGSQMFVLIMVVAFLMIDSIIISGRRGEVLAAKPGLGQAFEDFSRRTSKYWVVNTVFGAIVAALDTVALMILGVPLAFTWGVFAFVTNYIPNIGFVIGLIPPALLGLLSGGVPMAIWVIVIFSVINFVAQAVIQPKVTGDAVGLNTTVTFVSLIFWAAIIGPLGAILAVPLTLFFKALLVDSDPRSRWLGVVFDSRGKPNDLRWTTDMLRDEGRVSLRRAYGRGPGFEETRERNLRDRRAVEAAQEQGNPDAAAQPESPVPAAPGAGSATGASEASPAPGVPGTAGRAGGGAASAEGAADPADGPSGPEEGSGGHGPDGEDPEGRGPQRER